MKIFLIGILVCCGLLSGCSTTTKMSESPLQYRDTLDFKTNYRADGVLEVSGSVAKNSTMAPKVVRTEIVGDTLDIIVTVASADEKAKRNFSFKIKIEPQISTVRFGPDKEIIWQRK